MNVQDEIKALKERIAESEELLTKLEEYIEKEQEFPNNGDTYWFVDDTGDVCDTIYVAHESDEYRKLIGNIYKTEDEAEFALEKVNVEAELRKFSRPFQRGKSNYCLVYDTDSYYIDSVFRIYYMSQGAICFESEEKVQEAIETVGADRIKKYLFGVEG